MKHLILKGTALVLAAVAATSCTTSYDAYGYPRQSVDPLAAAAVAGVAGYAIGQNNRPKYYGNPYYAPRPYPRPYYYRPHRHWH